MFHTLTQVGLPLALILIMTGVGLGLTPRDFTRVFVKPRAFLIGAVCQMLLLPLIAVGIIAATGLHGEIAIGLFILALCPGGTTSNLFSLISKADVGLSVSLTAVIGFITPFTIPLLGAWAIGYYSDAGNAFELPILSTWIKLIVITVIPVLIGMGIRAKWKAFAIAAEPYVSRFSIIVLALVIASICVNLGEKLISFAVQAGPAALLLNISTMALGYFAGRAFLHIEAQARTISLEVGLQNGTLALLVTTGILNSPEMSIAPSIYSLLMFVTASVFTMLVLRKDRHAQATPQSR
ncbi:MAG: bile acid:sodium symporter family protein [Thalassolituus oleivorans]|uniref:bile acid:sodium symporter family protein n=1 Tax=Thalassolituus oleivorans TaxID=187493 RepID=UPI001B594683|nr:bile acid:sodium symporter family protein [Thalassolituus oleivorans]MBQ0728552.1 bile acid:sodium symporter family protein [Thalassolituus oleivorans]